MHSDINDEARDQGPPALARDGASEKAGAAASSAVINDSIGIALKAHYRALTEAPLPDRFLVLLAELEAIDAPHDK